MLPDELFESADKPSYELYRMRYAVRITYDTIKHKPEYHRQNRYQILHILSVIVSSEPFQLHM